MNKVGVLLQAKGLLKDAGPFNRRALEGYGRTLGRDDFDTLESSGALGLVLKVQGSTAKPSPTIVALSKEISEPWDAIILPFSVLSTTWA